MILLCMIQFFKVSKFSFLFKKTFYHLFTHSEPVDPVAPEDIVFMEVESESVVIQWTVAYISYSPETYVVQYGTSRETLVHNSSRRASEVGTTTYSVPLSGLRAPTMSRFWPPTLHSDPVGAVLRASPHCPPWKWHQV